MSRYSVSDYAHAGRALLPRGRAWPQAGAPVQDAVLTALAGTFARSDDAATILLDDAFPATTSALLDEWDASLGLPDPCAGPSPTDDQRRSQIVARLLGAGGQSRGRFINYAAALGFTIEIVNYAPFRAGRSTIGNPLASEAWTFVWGVRVLANATGLPVTVLKCELDAIKPAETTIIILS